MTKVAILIPSHISYDGQIDLLDNCIKSLLEQISKPKSIYISISFENDSYKNQFTNTLIKYGHILHPKIYFRISKEKKHQMEHLYNIYSNVDFDNYDMLMFCDDDDTYHVERVAAFISAFNFGKYSEKFGGVREHTKLQNNFDPSLEKPEYWCYGIIPNVIVDFFSFFKGPYYMLLQHKFGDLYFRHYLRKNSKYYAWVSIIDEDFGFTLYNYNIDNANSICGKIERGIGNFQDNLLFRILDCRSDSHFDKIIKDNSKIYDIDKKTIYYLKTIFHFCKSLYK